MEPSNIVTLTDVDPDTTALQAMIAQLSVTEDGEPLKHAMDDLKRALLENPAACVALLPEDIGKMVEHLNRMTGKHIAEEMAAQAAKAKKSAKPKVDFSNPNIGQEILDDLF